METKKPQKKRIKIKPYRTINHVNMIQDGGNAYIACSVKDSISNWSSYKVVVSDCEQKIQLTGRLNSIKERQNALYKLNVMIQDLINMRGHIVHESRINNLKIYNKGDNRNHILKPIHD